MTSELRSPAATPQSCAAVDDYALLLKLAHGGMGTVYVGCKNGAAGFERLVAVKCCHPHLRDDEQFVAMFLDEARLAARIHHKNVVATLDVSESDTLYLVMEYVEGESLATLLKHEERRGGRLPIPVVLRIMIDALSGLHAAHELRGADNELLELVHRDVTPANILVGSDGVARITDFGIAYSASRATVTQAGHVKGKYSYMAPEQLLQQRITRRADVFAAGIVLWEALTGRPLFRQAAEVATVRAVLDAEIVAPSTINPVLSRELDAVVLRALQREQDARYTTAAELAEALEPFAADATTRSVADYVLQTIGPALQQRREQIRAAGREAESLRRLARASSGPRFFDPTSGVITIDGGPLDRAGDPTASSRRPKAETAEPRGEDIEHRRMRGLFLAAMLLLVGSAIGVLLSRASVASAPPAATSAAPSQR